VVESVQEASYKDAVRVQIGNLYTVFVDALAARETLRYAQASRVGLNRLVGINETLYRKSNVTRADVGRVATLLDEAELAVVDAEETVRKTRRALANLLNLPPDAWESLQIRGTIADHGPPPPPSEELARIAMTDRPDLAAQRLGVARARADVRVARANRFGDAYVLYQPYTFQDNSPSGLKSSTSWALGVTVPVPIYNRNQGASCGRRSTWIRRGPRSPRWSTGWRPRSGASSASTSRPGISSARSSETCCQGPAGSATTPCNCSSRAR
jgi:cobalt-zinc-cadmium efflux system outer membrane protein